MSRTQPDSELLHTKSAQLYLDRTTVHQYAEVLNKDSTNC